MTERVALTLELTLGADGALPTEFVLFKAGTNRTVKGDIVYNAKAQKDVQAFAMDLARELVIDYEHASLEADSAQDPAKAGEAAGWFSVDAREDGVYATGVTWTDDAAARLKARKFRYFSPVVFRDPKTREITGIFNAALTNNPATKGQTPLVASITEKNMKLLSTLVAKLSLKSDISEEDVAAYVEKQRDERELLLAATGKTTVAEASASIAAWKKDAEEAPVLRTKVAELEGKQSKGEVLSLINAAKAEGKVSPAQVPLLEKMGARSIDELKEFLSAAPVIAPVKNPAKEPGTAVGAVVLTPEDKTIAAMLAVKPEDLAKTKQSVGPVVPVVDVTQKPTV